MGNLHNITNLLHFRSNWYQSIGLLCARRNLSLFASECVLKVIEEKVLERRARLLQSLPQSSTSNCSRSFKQSMSQGGEHVRMSEDVKAFRKAFLDMEEMVKVLYEERNTKVQGESSRPPRGECSPREEGNKNGDKPPSSPQSSCFSTALMRDASV